MSADHEICKRCRCCSVVYEMVPCWSCGGFCGEDYEDEWDDGWCDVCEGEGEVPVCSCLGNCDENGVHAKRFVDEIKETSLGERQ